MFIYIYIFFFCFFLYFHKIDYYDRKYPSVSCILDFLRCSLTYNNLKDLLDNLNGFIDKINNKEIPELISIVRIKNGFKNILSWKNFNDAEYCDVKFNVIYFDKDTNKSMIVEIQFLLKFLLKAKKMGMYVLLS